MKIMYLNNLIISIFHIGCDPPTYQKYFDHLVPNSIECLVPRLFDQITESKWLHPHYWLILLFWCLHWSTHNYQWSIDYWIYWHSFWSSNQPTHRLPFPRSDNASIHLNILNNNCQYHFLSYIVILLFHLYVQLIRI